MAKVSITKGQFCVILACIAFTVLTLGAIGAAGRERSKRAICMVNLKQLTIAWNRYADDNNDRIVNGDTREYATMYNCGSSSIPRSSHCNELPWVERDWSQGMTPQQKENAIRQGALYPYVQELRVYKCPTGESDETRSYSIVDAMNCIGWTGGPMDGAIMLKTRAEIDQHDKRIVFLDNGGNASSVLGSWTCYVSADQWWDPPCIRHAGGGTFSFTDGHVEYWPWQDQRTIEFGKRGMAFSPLQPGNPDIQKVQFGAWGLAALR